jgi:hypothetical protein
MTYFNANVDTLYIGPSTSDRTTSIYLSALFPTETLGNLKFLAIAAEENPWYNKEVLESLPVAFPALQLLTAVCCDVSIWSVCPEFYKDRFNGPITLHQTSDYPEFPKIRNAILTRFFTAVKNRRLAGRRKRFQFNFGVVGVLRGGNQID